MVDTYHRIFTMVWCIFWGVMQDLSNMRGGYLPPYLHSGLVFIFIHNPHDSQSNMQSGYLTPYFQWSVAYFGIKNLSSMSGGYLQPYLHSGQEIILECKTFPQLSW